MKYTPLFSQKDIRKFTDHFQEEARKKFIVLLKQVGEYFVREARLKGNYLDHTGNLRSSIGYMIALNGTPLFGDFKKAGTGTDGEKGKEQAYKLAKTIASGLNGYSIVGVAGMEYASAVEAKGKDVITGSSIRTEKFMRDAMNAVLSKI